MASYEDIPKFLKTFTYYQATAKYKLAKKNNRADVISFKKYNIRVKKYMIERARQITDLYVTTCMVLAAMLLCFVMEIMRQNTRTTYGVFVFFYVAFVTENIILSQNLDKSFPSPIRHQESYYYLDYDGYEHLYYI